MLLALITLYANPKADIPLPHVYRRDSFRNVGTKAILGFAKRIPAKRMCNMRDLLRNQAKRVLSQICNKLRAAKLTKAGQSVLLALGSLACLGANCGPTPEEEGLLVLTVAPFVYLLGMGMQWALLRIWRRQWPEIERRWLPNVIVFCVLMWVSLCSMKMEYLFFAVTCFSCSYLTTLLIATRIWLRFERKRIFWLCQPVVSFVMLAPAIPLALQWADEESLINWITLFLWKMPVILLALLKLGNYDIAWVFLMIFPAIVMAILVEEASKKSLK